MDGAVRLGSRVDADAAELSPFCANAPCTLRSFPCPHFVRRPSCCRCPSARASARALHTLRSGCGAWGSGSAGIGRTDIWRPPQARRFAAGRNRHRTLPLTPVTPGPPPRKDLPAIRSVGRSRWLKHGRPMSVRPIPAEPEPRRSARGATAEPDPRRSARELTGTSPRRVPAQSIPRFAISFTDLFPQQRDFYACVLRRVSRVLELKCTCPDLICAVKCRCRT